MFRTFQRLMMTSSPQYDFIKGQLLTYLRDHQHGLHAGIAASINREGDSPDSQLLQFFKDFYTRFDLIRRSKFGRLKFERALHFGIKAKLVGHPLDLMGSRLGLRQHWYRPHSLEQECCRGRESCCQGAPAEGQGGSGLLQGV